jgi:hypothetical protein
MDRAGAARVVTKEDDLIELLTQARLGEITLPQPPSRTAIGASEMIERIPDRPAPVKPAAKPARTPMFRPYRWATAIALIALLAWTLASPWVGGLAGAFMSPESVSASNLPSGSIALVVRVNDPAVAKALEDTIIAENLPIAMFVDAKAASGVYPASGVVLGVAQHGSSTMLVHPLREWDNDSDVAEHIRLMQGTNHVYVLPPKGGRTLLASALAPGSTKELVSVGRHKLKHSGIVELDASGMTINAATTLIHDELSRMHEAGYKCVSLPSLS